MLDLTPCSVGYLGAGLAAKQRAAFPQVKRQDNAQEVGHQAAGSQEKVSPAKRGARSHTSRSEVTRFPEVTKLVKFDAPIR